jgi:hypothetical protein
MAEALTYALENLPGVPGRIELHLGDGGAVDLRYDEPSSGGGPPAAYRFQGTITDAPFIAWLRAFPPSDPARGAWPLEPPLPCELAYVEGGKRYELGRDFKLTRDNRTSGTFSFLHRIITTASGGMITPEPGAGAYAFNLAEERAPEPMRADDPAEIEITGVIRLTWGPEGARAELPGGEPFYLSAAEVQELRSALGSAGFPAFLPRGPLPGTQQAPGLVRGVWGDQPFAFTRSPEERRALRRWGPALRVLEDMAAARIRSPGSVATPPDPSAQAEGIVYRTSAISPDALRANFARTSPGALSVTLDQDGRVSIEYADPSRGARYRWRARWSSPTLASLLPFEIRASGAPRRSTTPPAWVDVLWRGGLYDVGFHALALPANLLEQVDAIVRRVTSDTVRIDAGHWFGGRPVDAAEVRNLEETVDLDDPSSGEPLAPFDEVHYKDAGSTFHRAPAITISLTRTLITKNGASTPISTETLAMFDALVAKTRLPLFEPYLDRMLRPDSTVVSLEVRRGARRAAMSIEYHRAHAHPRFGALFTALRRLAGPA